MWTCPVDGSTLGLAGAAQVFRIDRKVQTLRRGQVLKASAETVYGVTSLWPEEAQPAHLQDLVRGYWAIETRQHYRRDHTQREDHCRVRNSTAARNLSLMRSTAIFLFERQRRSRRTKATLPDWQRKNMRHPGALISLLAHPDG